MPVDIIPNAPHARCYKCKKPQIDMLCHHCGRAICSSNHSTRIPGGKAIKNPEFAKLDLSREHIEETGVHCEECIHFVCLHKYRFVIWGIISLIGLFMFLASEPIFFHDILSKIVFENYTYNSLVWGFTFAISLFSFFMNLFEHVRHCRSQKNNSNYIPPFPVIGKLESVSVIETMSGSVELDATGKYIVKTNQPMGKMQFDVHCNSFDIERLSRYRKKFKGRGEPSLDNGQFHAGFAVLRGYPNLQFEKTDALQPIQMNTLVLTGIIGEHPFFNSSKQNSNDNLSFSYSYKFNSDIDRSGKLPIEIFPVYDNSDGIYIVLQVTKGIKNNSALNQARVEELRLYFPQELSGVAAHKPEASIVPPGEAINPSIKWTGCNVTFTDTKSPIFFIRFEKPIKDDTTFSGKLKIRFNGNFSGMDSDESNAEGMPLALDDTMLNMKRESSDSEHPEKDSIAEFSGSTPAEQDTKKHEEKILFFYPQGNKRRENISLKHNAIVDIEFTFTLQSLHFQQRYSAGADVLKRNGIEPNHHVIRQLTDAISTDEGFYIKTVVESSQDSHRYKDYVTVPDWDIKGRYYDGLFPIEFHIAVKGEKNYRNPLLSNIEIDILNVDGMAYDEMAQAKIKSAKEKLTNLIEEVLDNLTPETSEKIGNEQIVKLHSQLQELENARCITENIYAEIRRQYEQELKRVTEKL